MLKILEIKDFDFTYRSNEKTTLHDINLCLEESQSLGITGESGSGKTTLGLQFLRLAEGRANGVIRFREKTSLNWMMTSCVISAGQRYQCVSRITSKR